MHTGAQPAREQMRDSDRMEHYYDGLKFRVSRITDDKIVLNFCICRPQ